MDPLRFIATDLTDPAPAFPEPDFTFCDASYGHDLVRLECLQAANALPHGSLAWPYALRPTPGFNAPFRLPISLNMGGCYISVEAAGPRFPPAVNVPPSHLRLLAAITIQKCVDKRPSFGGFSTYGLHHIFDPLLDVSRDMNEPLPPSTTFLTLTVSGPEKKLSSPGNTDPSILLALAQKYRFKSLGEQAGSEAWSFYTFMGLCCRIDAETATRNDDL
ncbi:MAG: hypothetical protein Q9187_007037 [Circinaria calcarea]